MQCVVHTAASNGELLHLGSANGTLVGVWRGNSPVAVGEEVHVELDVEKTYEALSFEHTSGGLDRFEVLSKNAVAIIGRVEDVDAQGVLVLRGGGTFVSFDVEGQLPVNLRGAVVRVVVDDLQIYPTNL
jgi:hypothetical protein